MNNRVPFIFKKKKKKKNVLQSYSLRLSGKKKPFTVFPPLDSSKKKKIRND